MSHVLVPPGNTVGNGWFENGLYDTAACKACGAQLDVYQTDPALSGKAPLSTWVCSHKLENCIAYLAKQLAELEAQLKNASTGAMRAVYTRDMEDPK